MCRAARPAATSPAMAEPIGTVVKAGKPGGTVDHGHDRPVVGDDQDGVAGLIDHGGRNASRLQFNQASPGDRARARARAGVMIPIEFGQDEVHNLRPDSPLSATACCVEAHGSKAG
jgi:hypothetical protein